MARMATFLEGSRPKRVEQQAESRLPLGQYLVEDFPVLSAGPTPYTPLEEWTLSIAGDVSEPKTWTWDEMRALPRASAPTCSRHRTALNIGSQGALAHVPQSSYASVAIT
jgi:DMSO/TMAO reductase YedYZ molybdopterin-dependent catalytic subunit